MDISNINEIINLLVVLAIAAAVAGFMAGLLGVGGGIMLVPAIAFTLDFVGYSPSITMHIGVATSLALIVPTAISSTLGHYKKGVVDFQIIKKLYLFILIGAFFWAILAQSISGNGLRLIFGVIAIISSFNMMKKNQIIFGNVMPNNFSLNSFIGFIIGSLSAMIGIGGGTLSIPLMNAFSVDQHRATGTASAIGLIIAVPSTMIYMLANTSEFEFPDWSIGMVFLPVFMVFVPLTIIGAQLGVILAHKINGLILRRIFAIFLLIMATRMIYIAFQ